MDHKDIASRLARRHLDPEADAALRVSSEKKVQAMVRNAAIQGAFHGASLDLVEGVSSVTGLHASIQGNLQKLWGRLAHAVVTHMDSPMVSGKQVEANDHYKIEYPEQITFVKAAHENTGELIRRVAHDTELPLTKVATFFQLPAVQGWLNLEWQRIAAHNVAHANATLGLHNHALDAAAEHYRVASGKVPEDKTPWVDNPVFQLTKAAFNNGRFVLAHSVTFEVTAPEITYGDLRELHPNPSL